MRDAISFVTSHPETEPLSDLAYRILEERGAAAIRAAVAEERAGCERLAGTERDVRLESAARADDDSWATIERLRAATADNIAAAIRARGDAT